MRFRYWSGFLLLLIVSLPAWSFDTVDQQIDHYLGILAGDNHNAKVEMLKRLKWTAITDPRLYDEIEKAPASQGFEKKLDKLTIADLAYKIRALGYSGNPKYQPTLNSISKDAPIKKLRKHATKALVDLKRFEQWNRQIAQAEIGQQGKSVEITTYLKMLNVEDTLVQRFAAKAIVDGALRDPDLLNEVAAKLQGLYTAPGLDKRVQDTAAWFIRALGDSGDYRDLLTEVNQNTPYKKLKKYSIKYIR